MLHMWAARNLQIDLVQVDTSPRWRAIGDLSTWKRVFGGALQLVRDYFRFLIAIRGIDVVHLTTSAQLATFRDLAISLTAGLFRLPVVYHLHFGRIPQIAERNSVEWRLLTKTMKRARVVVALDEASAETLKMHFPQKRIEIVPNPIDAASLPSPSKGRTARKCLLFMGWLLPSKGVEDLLVAWSQVSREDWDMVIAGPGAASYQEDLVKRFSAPRVHFVGEVPHEMALQMIADCDLFVLPSHTEGFPFVVLEALALGRATVGTSVGAIPQLLEGECGMLVKPKDVRGLAEALERLMGDDALRARLGAHARDRIVATYTTDKVFSQLGSIWLSCRSLS